MAAVPDVDRRPPCVGFTSRPSVYDTCHVFHVVRSVGTAHVKDGCCTTMKMSSTLIISYSVDDRLCLQILIRFLLGKFADMQTFAGESMTAEGGMAFGYYKEGAHNPTFAYISKALEAEKVRSTILSEHLALDHTNAFDSTRCMIQYVK